eukprot:scaffold61495_cov72-Phaeocystis_antarctica.AAC.1
MAADPRVQRGLSSWVLQASWRVPCARSTFSRLIFLGSLFGILARLIYKPETIAVDEIAAAKR